jgi:hypothetical protein
MNPTGLHAPCGDLPRQVRAACADIEIIWYEQAGIGHAYTPTNTGNTIPDLAVAGNAAGTPERRAIATRAQLRRRPKLNESPGTSRRTILRGGDSGAVRR